MVRHITFKKDFSYSPQKTSTYQPRLKTCLGGRNSELCVLFLPGVSKRRPSVVRPPRSFFSLFSSVFVVVILTRCTCHVRNSLSEVPTGTAVAKTVIMPTVVANTPNKISGKRSASPQDNTKTNPPVSKHKQTNNSP